MQTKEFLTKLDKLCEEYNYVGTLALEVLTRHTWKDELEQPIAESMPDFNYVAIYKDGEKIDLDFGEDSKREKYDK